MPSNVAPLKAHAMDTNQDQTKPAGETEAPGASDASAITITVTPELLAALGVPADQATPESVLAAVNACGEKAKSADTITAQLATVTGERDAAAAKLKEIEEAKTMAEVDALLADYDLPEAALPAMRDLAKANREQATALLGAVPKKAAKNEASAEAAKAKAGGDAGAPPPPKPIHDPNAPAELTPEQKSAEAEKLIKAVQKEGRFKDYTAAREEARRREPELFT
jgi:hypothetical protein